MESSAFIIDDAEFLTEALAILDSFADEHLRDVISLPSLLAEDSGVTVTVEGLVDAATQQDGNSSCGLESFASTTTQEERSAALDNCPRKQQDQESCGDPKTTMPKAQGRGRMRIHEQLIQLRSVVKQMKTHLETLKSPNSPRFGDCVDSDVLAATNKSHPSQIGDETVWKGIAMEQFRARREAELHNAQLRENLSANILLSERVKKLLQSQHPHPNEFLDEDDP